MTLELTILVAALLALVAMIGAFRMAQRRAYGQVTLLAVFALLSAYVSWSALDTKLSGSESDEVPQISGTIFLRTAP